jgi:hypothetical protein
MPRTWPGNSGTFSRHFLLNVGFAPEDHRPNLPFQHSSDYTVNRRNQDRCIKMCPIIVSLISKETP